MYAASHIVCALTLAVGIVSYHALWWLAVPRALVAMIQTIWESAVWIVRHRLLIPRRHGDTAGCGAGRQTRMSLRTLLEAASDPALLEPHTHQVQKQQPCRRCQAEALLVQAAQERQERRGQ